MFGELFVLLRFKLNSPVESRPRVGSGVQDPAEQPQHEAGAASVVGSDLDVASHVYHQLWQRQGRGNQTVSFTPGSASHAGTCDLAAFWSCQHASRPHLNQTGSMCRSHGISLHQHLQEFQLTSKMISALWLDTRKEVAVIPALPWGDAEESVAERTLELVFLLSCLWSLMFAMMAAALRASTSSGDWLDCGSETQQRSLRSEDKHLSWRPPGLHPCYDCITEMNFNHACPKPL